MAAITQAVEWDLSDLPRKVGCGEISNVGLPLNLQTHIILCKVEKKELTMFRKKTPKSGFGSNEESAHCMKANPSSPQLDARNLFNKAIELCRDGDLPGAISLFHEVINIDKLAISAHYNLAKAYKDNEDYEHSIYYYRKALNLDPTRCTTWIEYASALKGQNQYAEATKALEHALRISNKHKGAMLNMGLILYMQSLPEKAVDWFQKVLDQDPSHTDAVRYLALSCQMLGQRQRALEILQKGLAQNPDCIPIQRDLSLMLLANGQFGEAWPLYECRFYDSGKKRVVPYCLPSIPRLDSSSEIFKDLRCLIVAEQGLGDILQFCRFIPNFKRILPLTRFCCPSDLHPILRYSRIDNNPLDAQALDLSEFDAWIPLLSIPQLLGINEPRMVSPRPYLKLPIPIKHLSAQPTENFVIGIHWQGSTSQEDGKLSIGRSFPLDHFKLLPDIRNSRLLSLQIGNGLEQTEMCSFLDRFIQDPRIDANRNLIETGQLIQLCDLVITNDTSIAHFSAGLGKRTYILLKNCPDWRWAGDSSSSYWYESVTLFRQEAAGDWAGVFKKVTNAIMQEFGGIPQA